MKQIILTIAFFSMLSGIVFFPRQIAAEKANPEIGTKLQNQTPEARFALLIGVNDYQDPSLNLNGTENDVELIGGVLGELYKFNPDKDIVKLVSSKTSKTPKPTKANIEKAFREHLIGNAKKFKESSNLPADKGATVVFYYSGHGSYVDDQPTVSEGRDEADGKDETIVPYDALRKSGANDIRDDDINKWFTELRKQTTNITFIFDSCHSGTATRGAGNRSVTDRETSGGGTRGDGANLNETMDEGSDYVTISGSLPNEKAQEDVLPVLPKPGETINESQKPKRQYNGYLTYYLAQQLRENRGLTYRELMQLVSTAVNKKNPDQTPQAEGDVDRAFLGTKESRNKRAIAVKKVEKETVEENGKQVTNSILTIEAGRIVGALPGGSVGIYAENAAQLAGDADRLAVGRIFETSNYTSKVRVTGKEISEKAKIVLATPFFTDEKRKVAIDTSKTDAGAQILKRLKASLEKNDYVAPLETAIDFQAQQKDWSVAVVRDTYRGFKEGKTKSAKKDVKALTDTDEVFYLASPNGNPLYNFYVPVADEKADDRIKDALEKHTRIENMLALNNGAAGAKINEGLKVELVRLKNWQPGEEGEPCKVTEYTPAELQKMKEENSPLAPGDYFYFLITNNTANDLFPFLFNISTDGAIQDAHSPKADGDILPKGKTVPTIAEDRCSGLYRAAEPFGKETFKLIATSKRFDPSLLTQPGLGQRKGDESALDLMFAQAGSNRRSEAVQVPFSGWGTTKLEIEIVPKK